MSEHKPFVPHDTKIKDITFKSVFFGAIFGIIFGSANAYLGLVVGLTISTAIPLAVISVAMFRAIQPLIGKSTILDANISQTTGSASSSLASGVIFTIPALFIWGMEPSLFQMGMLAMLGGILGILFMIPLRRFLIVKEHGHLPYPEGTASAEVLIAAEEGGAKAKNIFIGMGVGALYKSVLELLKIWPKTLQLGIPAMKKGVIGLKTYPALLGVGYILGYRISAIMVAGGLLSWVGIIPVISYFGDLLNSPIPPEEIKTIAEMTPYDIWDKYIRFIGAGAVAFAGLVTVIKSLPTMYKSLKIGLSELKLRNIQNTPAKIRTDDDLPMYVVLGGVITVVLILGFVPGILGIGTTFTLRILGAIAIAFFAFVFVTVSSRIVGLVGVSSNPTSGMAIVTLLGTSLAFFALGYHGNFGKATALTIGTVVCVAASIAGDISQDLKTGYLIGATPKRQQIAEIIGAIVSAFFICGAVWMLGNTFTFGSADLAAPQATLMKTVIDGVFQANLPWELVLAGASLAAVAELFSIPSLPFAVGIYLPLDTMTPVFVGGCIRYFVEKSAKGNKEIISKKKEKGILLSSGLIAGEGLLMVIVAAYAFVIKAKPAGIGFEFTEPWGEIISFAAFGLLAYFLVSKTRIKKND
jgi:putative OPT family oligopeptide transporter